MGYTSEVCYCTPRLIAKEEYGRLDVVDKDTFDEIIKRAGYNAKEKNA